MSEQAIIERDDFMTLRTALPAHRSQNVVTPMEMLATALERGVDPDTLGKLMALQERWEANQGKKAFNSAIADAKAAIAPVVRNAKGHNGQYADFSAYATAIDATLAKHGLNYRFRTTQTDRITVTCILSHRDGYSEENSLSGSPDTSGSKNSIQAIGSTQTYLMRYTLIGALGLSSTKDDNGAAAGDDSVLTADQIAQIRKALDFRGRTEEQLLKHIKLESLEDIRASKFKDVLAIVNRSAANG